MQERPREKESNRGREGENRERKSKRENEEGGTGGGRVITHDVGYSSTDQRSLSNPTDIFLGFILGFSESQMKPSCAHELREE